MLIDDFIDKGKTYLYKEDQKEVQKEHFKAVIETTIHQIEKCGLYRQLCKQKNFDPRRDLKSVDDIKNIPYLTSANFKGKTGTPKKFLCVPESDIQVWQSSSGTSGDPSLIGKDPINLKRYVKVLNFGFAEVLNLDHFDWTLYFTPRPQKFYTIEDKIPDPIPSMLYVLILTNQTPMENRFYALKRADEEARKKGKIFDIDSEGTLNFLNSNPSEKGKGWVGGAIPLLYSYFSEMHKKTGQTFECGEDSVVVVGGGWKSFAGEQVSPEKFREVISRSLGIPQKNIRDSYNFSETDCMNPECEYHNKHVLPWEDIIIRDVETLEPVEMGETGLVNVINPIAYSYAGVSILQDDIAKITMEDNCPCGRRGKVIEIIGRAQGAEGKGCGAQLTGETDT